MTLQITEVFSLVVASAKSLSYFKYEVKLLNFSNNHKTLHRSQIGFLPGHREHIFSLRTLIDQHTHSPRGKLYTCFVDFKKAFDSIWHQGLP